MMARSRGGHPSAAATTAAHRTVLALELPRAPVWEKRYWNSEPALELPGRRRNQRLSAQAPLAAKGTVSSTTALRASCGWCGSSGRKQGAAHLARWAGRQAGVRAGSQAASQAQSQQEWPAGAGTSTTRGGAPCCS